jgi:homogentisate 1,2-dioxygenase
MLDRITRGHVPSRPHSVVKAADGSMLYEECLTRAGFDGPYSILYHRHRPHEALPTDAVAHGFRTPPAAAADDRGLLRRHYRCLEVAAPGGPPVDCRIPLLHNRDVTIGFARPTSPDPVYFANGDADDLFFILRGAGTLRSVLGDLRFGAGDYVGVPKGVLHRFVPDPAVAQAWLSIECKGGLALPRGYRNAIGQLRMDAPYSHRDFRRPELGAGADEKTDDEGIRDLVVKRGDRFFGFRTRHAPLDVVGWDGTVYPFALPIAAFRPRVGQLHLPPPVHATFEAGGALICSFVPRPLDFDPAANPCPYPHASVDVDEVLFYANGAFGSRRGVGEGSLSHHPAGIAHGPHPGAYESAPGQTRTEELAVMLDCAAPLFPTAEARSVEDAGYHASFVDDQR